MVFIDARGPLQVEIALIEIGKRNLELGCVQLHVDVVAFGIGRARVIHRGFFVVAGKFIGITEVAHDLCGHTWRALECCDRSRVIAVLALKVGYGAENFNIPWIAFARPIQQLFGFGHLLQAHISRGHQ